MMPRWGARIINRATGSVQVDDLYENMALISKITQSANSNGSIATAVFTYVGADMPAIAFSCTSAAFVSHVLRNDGANTWAFTIQAYSSVATNITVYEFGRPPVLGPGWGVRIKRGGIVKFDSRHKYARIATTLRGNVDVVGIPYGGAGPGVVLPAGKTYAILIGSSPGRNTRYIQNQGGTQTGYIDSRYSSVFGVAVSGGAISSVHIQTYFNSTFIPVPPAPPPGSPWDYQMPQYSWAILDVTNY